MKMDPDIDPVVREVLDVAALLDTTEFNIFCLAYVRWFGRDAPTSIIEPYFNDYMFQDIVPYWVHHFTRQIIYLYYKNQLNVADYGLTKPPLSRRMAFIGRVYAVVLVLILVALFILAMGSDHLFLGAKNCFFPPCY